MASTFTTTDPYDANDTLSQAMAKSFYEGLYGFDKDMKMIPVLAESYTVSKDGLVYTVKLKKGIKFHDGTDFKAEAVKVELRPRDQSRQQAQALRASTTTSPRPKWSTTYTARITLKTPFSAFINKLAHPSGVMISPAALKQVRQQGHRIPSGRHRSVQVRRVEGDRLPQGREERRLLAEGPTRRSTRSPGSRSIDSNSRAAVMQTGEAHFTYPVPYELAEVLKAKPDLEVVAAPSIIVRYLSMNTQQKPFDNPKVRQAINYAINKDAVAKIAFGGYATPADAIVPEGVEYSVKLGVWPYDVAKAKQLLTEAGYPNGFETELWSAYNHTIAQKVTQVLQQQLQQIGIKTKITLLEAGQRVEKVESWQDPATAPVRLYYVGWSSSTGEADWALRPLLVRRIVAAEALQHRLLQERRGSTPTSRTRCSRPTRREKAKLYKDAQETIYKDAPWAPLVTEKLLSAKNKKLTGVYTMPDGSFNFTEIDLK